MPDSSAGAESRAAISQLPPGATGSWIQHDGIETDRRVHVASFEPREIEWIRSDLASDEISKFVSATARNNNPRRCHGTSTSSGYSSHSPPLSAGSYSCYAPALTKDPLYGDLAVIHESETIPRPVWLPIVYRHENRNYEGVYVCRVCGCAYNYSSPSASYEAPFGLPPDSVIDDNIIMPPGDIWCNISRVPPGIASRNNVYEYVCPPWLFDRDPSTSCVAPKRLNPINSEFYVSPRCFYERDTVRSAGLLKSKTTRCKEDSATEGSGSDLARETRGPYIRKYLHGKHHIENGCAKLPFGLEGDSKECQRAISTESKYSMQLEYGSDVGSSYEETVVSANDLNRRLAAAGSSSVSEDLDFTLDVARAERLGRAIARAKQRRQWCRVLTVLLGLVFFMLSVIVVSLSVTRGRKMFGSM